MTRLSITRISVALGLTLVLVVLAAAIYAWPRFRTTGMMDQYDEMGVIQGAAMSWRQGNPGSCPTVEQLVAKRYLDGSFKKRQLCREGYRIECHPEGIIVVCGN